MTDRLWSPHDGGSSGLGISKIIQTVKCAKQAKWDSEAQKIGAENSFSSSVIWVGSMVHQLLQCYYTGITPHFELDENDRTSLQNAQDKAWKVFRRYRADFPADEWGRIVECEVDHNNLKPFFMPAGMTYSCKFDLIVKPTVKACKNLQKTRAVPLMAGTYYLVDHKTAGSFAPGWEDKYYESLQFVAYAEAFKLMWPKRIFGGTIVNVIGTGATKKHETLLVQPPTINMRARLVRLLGFYKANKRYPMGNPTECMSYGKKCFWLHNGCEGF